ncbi:YjjG family noncanonical pyrimidine nucleotidase [Flammeovirgaceae bacterium SG7u.111]|nr:YjjG family noncanonical pyrimidine nucleotidase [Flammeovirgaceae bacterium SG7u.132]WPO35613.1 YjjG family noncanonical pyrimidine nucleotidase [Flammeovirgaceae bacterium SG7u.111]
MKKNYTHIFFDLDHTLWDFDRNSTETLFELYEKYQLENLSPNFSCNEFVATFRDVNFSLWDSYDKNLINKDQIRNDRFKRIFEVLGIAITDSSLTLNLGSDYLQACPQKPHLLDNSQEILSYLYDKYKLHIITNGFDDVQHTKLKSSNIFHFFDVIVTSESTGYKKPHHKIFEYALSAASASVEMAIMVGDNLETDIKGAIGAKLDCIFYNPEKKGHTLEVQHEISHLSELKDLL